MTNQENKKYDIKERAFDLAVAVARITERLPRTQSLIEYKKQIIRSSASVGANLEEADGTLSKRDFVNKMAISRREARETRYWLKLIMSVLTNLSQEQSDKLIALAKEAEEIMLIISSIINKVKDK